MYSLRRVSRPSCRHAEPLHSSSAPATASGLRLPLGPAGVLLVELRVCLPATPDQRHSSNCCSPLQGYVNRWRTHLSTRAIVACHMGCPRAAPLSLAPAITSLPATSNAYILQLGSRASLEAPPLHSVSQVCCAGAIVRSNLLPPLELFFDHKIGQRATARTHTRSSFGLFPLALTKTHLAASPLFMAARRCCGGTASGCMQSAAMGT